MTTMMMMIMIWRSSNPARWESAASILLVSTTVFFCCLAVNTMQDGDFVATEDWQEIKDGQKVPSGLHYRINLQTGKKEAKLLQDDDEPGHSTSKTNNNQKALVSVPGQPEDGLKEAKERTVKKEKAKVNRDIDAIKLLMGKFGNASSDDGAQALILQDLDYLMHQVDDARDFVTMGGLESIIKPSLLSSKAGLVSMGALVLGSASQSNGPVQDSALDQGLMDIVLGLLTKWDRDDEIRRKAIFALSSLSRGNRRCLEKLVVELQGLQVLLVKVLNQEASSTRLKIKTLSLVNDLWREGAVNETATSSIVDEALKASMDQWCSVFTGDPRLFLQAESSFMNHLEAVERISDILLEIFARPCRLPFSQCPHLKGWLDKSRRYVIQESLADQEDPMMAQEYRRILSNVEGVAAILSRIEL